MTRPREQPVFIKSLSGSDLSAGASVYVPLDNAVGAPARTDEGEWGGYTGLRIRLRGTLDTHVDMTQSMPGTHLADIITNVRVKAGGQELLSPGISGEDLNAVSFGLTRGFSAPIPADVADATAAAVDTGDVWVTVPFTPTMRDRFGRENDDFLPIGLFDREIDGGHGLRFDIAAAVGAAQGNSSFKGFLNCVFKTITACDVYGMYRTQENLSIGMNAIRIFSESNSQFDLEPIGGPGGAQRWVAIFDPPSVTTGQRSHTGYSDIAARFGGQQLYTGRTYQHLVDMSNLADPSYPAISTAWQYLSRSAPQFLPIFSRRADQALSEDARGRLSVNIGTRTTSSQRLIQVCRIPYSSAVGQHLAKATGGAEMFRAENPRVTAYPVKSAGMAVIADQKLIRAEGK